MSTTRSELQEKAQSLLVQYAFFRWENAVIISLSLLLTVFLPRPLPRWPIWGWVVLGLVGMIMIVYSSLTDVDANARILVELMQERFDPRKIRSERLRKEVEKGLEYQRRIEEQVRNQRPGMMRDRLEDTAGQLSEWVNNIFQLALRLDAYDQDTLLRQERENVPKEVKNLEARLKLEANPETQERMQQVLEGKQKQLDSLQALDTRMKQAALEMDQSLTALATIYSQTRLIDAQAVASGRAERLRDDIQEQVLRLNDLVASINEVYNYETKGLG